MIKAGVLCGDRWHPAATVMTGLREAVSGTEAGTSENGEAGERLELEQLPQGTELSREWLAGKDVIVLAKLNHISEENVSPWLTSAIKSAIMDFVADGGGLAVIHAGTAGFKDDAAFCRFIGGVFDYHPESCRVTLTINAAAAPFAIAKTELIVVHDEHYMMDMADDSVEVFMTSNSEHGTQAAGWVRYHGEGKICVLTPGHFLEAWREPSYRDLIAEALLWCAAEGRAESETRDTE